MGAAPASSGRAAPRGSGEGPQRRGRHLRGSGGGGEGRACAGRRGAGGGRPSAPVPPEAGSVRAVVGG